MPLVSGTITLNGSAQQLTTTSTYVVGVYFTTPASAVTISNASTVSAAGAGITPGTNTTFGITGPQGVFNLNEFWVIGTNTQKLTWIGVTR